MKHKRKKMYLEDVIIHIQIDEHDNIRDKVKKANEILSKAKLVDEKAKSNKNNRLKKNKTLSLA